MNAMSIELEHQLRFAPKIVRCVEGHTVATHTTDHGLCSCGLEIWSRHGRLEVYELHKVHWEFERKKAADAVQQRGEHAVTLHEIRWNDTRDCARCSWCDWMVQSTNTAKILVAWNQHLERVKDNA
ncbi:MAG: hypothetical protein A4E19_17980 [Nitrospira sp. SG-bin1]|nr:MAG: hypothetical protein A4E19_17980 [Nitrospira sp. SG-bin1]